MALDKELYRKAYQLYREWNEAKLQDQIRNAGSLSPEEAWKQYVALWSFLVQSGAKPGWWQTREKYEAIERYYDRVRRLEEMRAARVRKT